MGQVSIKEASKKPYKKCRHYQQVAKRNVGQVIIQERFYGAIYYGAIY
jgi:hypothetical protein